MNKRILLTWFVCVSFVVALNATEIKLYVDSAPNAYGSPDFPGWKTDAYAKAASGTFINMANSVDPANAGTTNTDIRDMVVYSFGDLGQRLHFVYWMPDTTIQELQAKNFAVSLDYIWDGVTYSDYFGDPQWWQPASWQQYNGGVIGTAGFAWWGAYPANTQAALDSDLAAWNPYQGDITFHAKMDGTDMVSLTAHHNTPDGGSSCILLSLGLIGLVWLRRRITG